MSSFLFGKPKPLVISALDVGSHSIKGLVVAKEVGSDKIEVLGYHSLPSAGLRKGTVVNPEKTSQKIIQLKSFLEKESKQRVKEALINIGGYHITVREGHGAVAISRADHKVSPEDIDRVIEETRSSIPLSSENREILEMHPKEYIIDSESGIKNPLDLKGIKLEVNALAICAFSPYIKNLTDSVLSADLETYSPVPSPLAAAEAVLTPKQKELGVVLVDIGAGSTGIVVFEEETMLHLAILPVGSSHISNDIAIALQTDIDIAEKIKLNFGEYIFKKSNKTLKVDLDSEEIFSFPVNKMAKAGKARVSEIFNLIKKELKKVSKADKLPAGVVLTGGGANLPGIVDFAKKELNLPVKVGIVKDFIGLEKDPCLATLAGLILKGIKGEEGEGRESQILSRVKKTFRIFVP